MTVNTISRFSGQYRSVEHTYLEFYMPSRQSCPPDCRCAKHTRFTRRLCDINCTCARHTHTNERSATVRQRWSSGEFKDRPKNLCSLGCKCGKHLPQPHRFRGGRTGDDFAAVLCPVGFVREHRIFYTSYPQRRYYQLDFAHVEAKVNIELDGPYHLSSEEDDKLRDTLLRSKGWKVIRIRHD